MESADDVVRVISERASEVGVRVWLHATEIDGPRSIGIDAEEPVLSGSVLKVPVAVELARQAAAGEVDLAERVTVRPGHRTASPYGLSAFRHDLTISWYDLAVLMIAVSDNVATDLIIERIGKAAIAVLLDRLGLTGTSIPVYIWECLESIGEDLGIPYHDDERALADLPIEKLAKVRALQPTHPLSFRTTAKEMTRLLGMIWRDQAAPAAACADVRYWLGKQVWPHRIRSGFSDDLVRFSGKTGTMPTARNEVSVVEYPDRRYAVGVFTRARDTRAAVPPRDALIGFAAAKAVAWLRS